jgi:hypothetical protein
VNVAPGRLLTGMCHECPATGPFLSGQMQTSRIASTPIGGRALKERAACHLASRRGSDRLSGSRLGAFRRPSARRRFR